MSEIDKLKKELKEALEIIRDEGIVDDEEDMENLNNRLKELSKE